MEFAFLLIKEITIAKTLSRRIILWKQGLLDDLFTEAKALQIRHPKQKKSEVNEEAKQFDKLMSRQNICRHWLPFRQENKRSTPGVRPIGIGEVLRRKIGKTITQCIKSDLKNLGKKFPTLLRPEVWNRICYPQLEEGV